MLFYKYISLYAVKGFFDSYILSSWKKQAPISEDLELVYRLCFKVGIPLFFFVEEIILHSFDFSF